MSRLVGTAPRDHVGVPTEVTYRIMRREKKQRCHAERNTPAWGVPRPSGEGMTNEKKNMRRCHHGMGRRVEWMDGEGGKWGGRNVDAVPDPSKGCPNPCRILMLHHPSSLLLLVCEEGEVDPSRALAPPAVDDTSRTWRSRIKIWRARKRPLRARPLGVDPLLH